MKLFMTSVLLNVLDTESKAVAFHSEAVGKYSEATPEYPDGKPYEFTYGLFIALLVFIVKLLLGPIKKLMHQREKGEGGHPHAHKQHLIQEKKTWTLSSWTEDANKAKESTERRGNGPSKKQEGRQDSRMDVDGKSPHELPWTISQASRHALGLACSFHTVRDDQRDNGQLCPKYNANVNFHRPEVFQDGDCCSGF